MTLASRLLTLSLVPLAVAVAIDGYLLMWLVLGQEMPSLAVAAALALCLGGLWFAVPQVTRARRPMSARPGANTDDRHEAPFSPRP